MTAPIEDVSSLPGQKVTDQEEVPIGEVKEIYAWGGDGDPMWVSVEMSMGMTDKRVVLIPIARLKEEDGALRVPYSKQHISETPQVEDDEISEECERQLRDHYGIDRADQELRKDNKSYATLVPDGEGTAQKVDDPDQVETPDADTRTEETKERLQDPGSSEIRQVDARQIAADSTGGQSNPSSSDEDEGEGEGEGEGESGSGEGEREDESGSGDGEGESGSGEGEGEGESEQDN